MITSDTPSSTTDFLVRASDAPPLDKGVRFTRNSSTPPFVRCAAPPLDLAPDEVVGTRGPMSAAPPSKREQLLKLLERGSVFVHLDPRREGVVVPPWLSGKPQLVLQLGLNFAIPIPDLVVDDTGVSCTLSFERKPFHCVLPWTAVYALVTEDGEVTVWPTDLPSEIISQPVAVRREGPTARGARQKPRPRMSLVPPPETGDATPATASVAPPPEEPAATVPEPDAAASRDERANDSLSRLPPPSEEDSEKRPRERPPHLRLIK